MSPMCHSKVQLSSMCHSKVLLFYGLPNHESMVVHSGRKIQYSPEARQGRVTMEDTMLYVQCRGE